MRCRNSISWLNLPPDERLHALEPTRSLGACLFFPSSFFHSFRSVKKISFLRGSGKVFEEISSVRQALWELRISSNPRNKFLNHRTFRPEGSFTVLNSLQKGIQWSNEHSSASSENLWAFGRNVASCRGSDCTGSDIISLPCAAIKFSVNLQSVVTSRTRSRSPDWNCLEVKFARMPLMTLHITSLPTKPRGVRCMSC